MVCMVPLTQAFNNAWPIAGDELLLATKRGGGGIENRAKRKKIAGVSLAARAGLMAGPNAT
jgi:hypothetical protein